MTSGLKEIIWATVWDFQQCGMCDQQSLRSAWAYAQSDHSLFWSLKYSMTVKLLTEQHLELLSLIEGCTGSYESTLAKMPHCWKSHAAVHITSINHKWTTYLVTLWNDATNKITYIWASLRENLSLGYPTKQDSNQTPQLQRLARILQFHMKQV